MVFDAFNPNDKNESPLYRVLHFVVWCRGDAVCIEDWRGTGMADLQAAHHMWPQSLAVILRRGLLSLPAIS